MPDPIRGLPNLIAHGLRRHGWRWHPARWQSLDGVPIDRPIFLVGLQGGGLTLLARMLRRNAAVVSATGNSRYWAGPDEMQNVLGAILPPDLSGLHAHAPPYPVYSDRDWLYATDELLPLYRRTADDATEEMARQFKRAIRLALKMHAVEPERARFVDKSQSFTVRMTLVQALLEEHDPHFILVTRNPYALCARSAMRVKSLTALQGPLERRLALAAQQWANSIACALEDASAVRWMHTLRFEDLLAEPEVTLRAVCGFAGLDYSEDMLPQPHHRFPLGATGSSRGDRKWYPLRPDVNAPYLEGVEPAHIGIIHEQCGPLAVKFGYLPPGAGGAPR